MATKQIEVVVKDSEGVFLWNVPKLYAEKLVQEGNAEVETYIVKLLRNKPTTLIEYNAVVPAAKRVRSAETAALLPKRFCTGPLQPARPLKKINSQPSDLNTSENNEAVIKAEICAPGASAQFKEAPTEVVTLAQAHQAETSSQLLAPLKPNSQLLNGTLKEKCCVVCGLKKTATISIIRKRIIPRAYTRAFPERDRAELCEMNTLPLCQPCHRKCTGYFDNMMKIIRYIAGVPANRVLANSIEEKTVAALKRGPHDGETAISEFLRTTFHCSFIDQKLNMPAGKAVYEFYGCNGLPLSHLRRLCRKSFVEAMHPMYLPRNWSVD